ncbi:MAG: Asp23/Gls24 family envelope stress response protein [bacterium]
MTARLPKPAGTIHFTPHSVQSIARAAAATVPGVIGVTERTGAIDTIRQWLNLPATQSAIALDPNGTQLTIDVAVEVAFGTPIPVLVEKVRKAVALQVTETTGFQVETVNVTIANIARAVQQAGTKARIK